MYALQINTHCGAAVLSRTVHGVSWRTDEANGSTGDWLPSEWVSTDRAANLLEVLVVISADESQLTVTYGDRAVVYRRSTTDDPEFVCA